MRTWLLLMSLLVSDLNPLGDGDWVMDYYIWSLCRKLLVSEPMISRGPGTRLTQTEHHCMCIRRSCVYVTVQHKQGTSPFYLAYTVHDDHRQTLPLQDLTEIICRSHIPALDMAPLLDEGKRDPAFLKSDPLQAMHMIVRDTPAKAGDGIGHIAMDIIKDRPNSGSAWLLHHHSAASGHNFQPFSQEKPESGTPAPIIQQRKMLTKRYCAATTVDISCCLKENEIRSAINIKKTSEKQISEPQIRQKESAQRAMDIKVLRQHDGQQSSKASISHHDDFQTAALHSGSSSVKTSDTSQLEIQRSEARIIKKNRHLNLVEGSTLQKSLKKLFSLRAGSSADDDDDGFYGKRQLLLVSREKKESINRPQHKLRAAQDDNNEDFIGEIITKQAELLRPEGESETQPSHTNTVENGDQRRLAYILQTDNNDVDHKQMLSEVGEEALITLFLPDKEMETQTEPPPERKLILNTDTGWKTVNIPTKELADPRHMSKVVKENFIIEADNSKNSKCKCLKAAVLYLDIYAADRRERIELKPAESVAEVTTTAAYTKEQVTETAETTQHTETNNAPHEIMSINHTKQEENVTSEQSVIPSPPSHRAMETETTTTTTQPTAETTTANTEIKQTTASSEAFSRGSTQRADGLPSTEETPTTTMSPEPETDTVPRFTKCKAKNIESTTGKSFSGLRMREHIPADEIKSHEGAANKERGTIKRPESAGKEDRNDPGVTPFTFSNPSETIHSHTDRPQSTGDTVPLCRGLIHRTEAGWKHCMERFTGTGSKIVSSVDTFKETGELQEEHTSIRDHDENLLDDDENDHFYYFDGVLKRVQNNFHPDYKTQRRQNRSPENRVYSERRKRHAGENLLSYIQRLTVKNKVSNFK